MSSSEINARKLDLIAWIHQLSDVNLITFLDGIRNSGTASDWWSEINLEQQQAVLKGLKDAEEGRVHSLDDFWNKLKNG